MAAVQFTTIPCEFNTANRARRKFVLVHAGFEDFRAFVGVFRGFLR